MEYGLIGAKLGHSYSKIIHEMLCGYHYDLCPLPTEEEARAFLTRRQFKAINVTIPYKKLVMEYCSYIDPRAKAIGAVNTVVNKNGLLYGYNTDYLGFAHLCDAHGVNFAGRTVLILGTGGTHNTTWAVAHDRGAKQIYTVSRHPDPEKGELTYAQALTTGAQIIINTTPVGMYPNVGVSALDITSMPGLEAVIDIICSMNDYALQSSVNQLKGSVHNKIKEIREVILYHTAFIESALDDPEHISVDGYGDSLLGVVKDLQQTIQCLLDTADDGRIIKEGIKTVIVGKPNAGKSSLMNVLVGEEKAIVTEIAGTTRDVLEENIQLQGVSLNIMDTAGIRDTSDIVEKIGVDKAKENAEKADLIIYVVDASRPLDENDHEIIEMIRDKKAVILLNKSDLSTVVDKKALETLITKPMIDISAKEETGIHELESTLKEMFYHGDISFNDEVYITNIRHKTALADALSSLKKVEESIENQMPEDFFTIDLMDAYESLGSITGETIGEDLVNEIFSKFCMGK